MFLMLCTLAVVFSQAALVENAEGILEPTLGDTQGLIALLAANGFVVFFGMSWGPAVWVLLGDVQQPDT